MILLALIGGVCGSIMLGRTMIELVYGSSLDACDDALPAAEIWGLSVVLGIGLTGWLSFLWSWSGGLLGVEFSAGLAGVGWLSGVWLVWKSRRAAIRSSVQRSTTNEGSHLVRSCQCLIGVLVVMAFLQTALTPQKFWDERAIFAIKAKVLFEDGSIFSSALHNPEFVQYHPKYPLMLPLIEQHVYALIGSASDRWSKIWFPLLYTGLVLLFSGACSRRFGAPWGWVCGLLLATVPVLMPDEYGFLCAQADAAVACFHGAAVLCLWDAMNSASSRTRSIRMLLGGFFASCAAFTKDEGIAFLVIDVLSWGLAIFVGIAFLYFRTRNHAGAATKLRVNEHKLNAIRLLIFMGTAGALLVPWFAHRRHLPNTTEMNYTGRISLSFLYTRLNTLEWSFPHLASRMFGEWRVWGLQWCVGLAAIATQPRKAIQPPQLFLILNLLGALTALLMAGMLAPAELEEHLGGSTHRFLMQIVPVVLLLIAAQWSDDDS